MDRAPAGSRLHRVKPAVEEKHLWDYVRVLYRTRWVTVPAFLIVFVPMTINTLRQAPRFQAVTQILIEEIAPGDRTSQKDGAYTDEFQQISAERRPPGVRVLDRAQSPRQASPNVAKDMTLAFVAGLVFALGLAFGVEYLDTRIKTPQELKATLAIPFLGMVPSLAQVKSAPSNPLLNDGVPQNFSEAFKTVRTNVLFSSMEEGFRTLVITSAGPAEGKSLVASNLAIALAQASQRVLLIDADMRRPRIHEIFGGEQEPGLSNLLEGSAEAGQAVRTSAIPGLWLIHAGHMPPNPAELLGSRQYADFIASLGDHFDWVVLDTPPVLVVADSSIVANQSSGVVFVVDADSTTRQAARAAVEQLDSAHAQVIGAVLNKVDLIRNPYFYSPHYRQDYGRHYVSAAPPPTNL